MFRPGAESGSFYASETPAEVTQKTDWEKTAENGSKNSQVLLDVLYTHNLLPAFKNLI